MEVISRQSFFIIWQKEIYFSHSHLYTFGTLTKHI